MRKMKLNDEEDDNAMSTELKRSYINALTSAANSAGGKDFLR